MAAEGHRVGEDGVRVEGAAGQHGRAVLHLVVGAASLDEQARAEYSLQVAVLLATHTNTGGVSFSTLSSLFSELKVKLNGEPFKYMCFHVVGVCKVATSSELSRTTGGILLFEK